MGMRLLVCGLGMRLGRYGNETTGMYSFSLLNHLQFVYHVTCSTITVKPGTDTIHSVRTTITQVHFVCVLSWATTVHFVCITRAYVYHINSLFLSYQESQRLLLYHCS